MRELLGLLGNPQTTIPAIHIAGTKGKGSTAAMVAAILSEAGYHVGLFTSPHIDRVEERIIWDGQPCSAEELTNALEQVRPAVEAMDRATPGKPGPTYFEVLTAAAWRHFVRQKTDVVVLEVGLGGRLDSTNVCEPILSILTSISFDHMQQLGNTLAAIAGEKAGIIKPGVPVISGVIDDEPRAVVRRVAQQNGCRLIELGVDFSYTYRPPQHLEREASLGRLGVRFGVQSDSDIPLGLLGKHQAANAAIAWTAMAELRRVGWNVPEESVRRGLAKTTWPARVEVISRRPAVILDAAHNGASIQALIDVLDESFSVRRRVLVFATTQEKDLPGMLERLHGHFDEVVFTRYLNNPRNVAPETLQDLAEKVFRGTENRGQGVGDEGRVAQQSLPSPACGREAGGEGDFHSDQDSDRPQLPSALTLSCLREKEPNTLHSPLVHIAPTPAEAWELACQLATPEDLICITGSFFLAADMRRHWRLTSFLIPNS
jgi:dihydrofolate synthase/folylpolyglutamate synthase